MPLNFWYDTAEVLSQLAFVVFVVGSLGLLAWLLFGFGGGRR